MKKFLIFALIVISSFLSAQAQQSALADDAHQWDADARPQMTGRLVDGSYVGQVNEITVGTAKVSAQSIPSFSGKSTWYFTYFDTAKPTEIKKEPKPKTERMSVSSGIFSTTVSWVPATETCAASASDCGLRVQDYQLTGLECGKTYKIRFHVDSLDSGKKTYSKATTFSTPACGTQNTFSVVVADIKKISDTQVKIIANANISQFPGSQKIEFSVALAREEEFTSSTAFSPVESVNGGGSVELTKIINQTIECDKKYKLVLKVKVSDKEVTTTVISPPSCASSVTNSQTSEVPEAENIYTFLTPLPLGDNLSTQKSTIIGTDAGVLGILNRIFTIMLVVAVALAVVFMIIGGAKYATGDTMQGKQNGRQTLTNAIVGLLFALLSWLLLNIINPDLVRFNLYLPNVGKVLTTNTTLFGGDTSSGTGSTVLAGAGCGNMTNEECFQSIKADDPRVRAELKAAKILTNHNDAACPRYGAENCTMVGRLNPETLSKLKKIKSECVSNNPDCVMTITGGTEYWLHSAGGNHPKFTAVDISINNPAFNSFIASKGKNIGGTTSFSRRFEYGGLRFGDETAGDRHWHVDTLSYSSGVSDSNSNIAALLTFRYINIRGPRGTGGAHNPTEVASRISSVKQFENKIKEIAGSDGSDWKLLYALVAQESRGNPQAGSDKGACGLTQILPGTARDLDSGLKELKTDEEVCRKLKTNTELSLKLGLKYLKQGGGTVIDKLARYNGGNDAVSDSKDCPGRKKYECPWNAPGYYNKSNPTGEPLKQLTDLSHINAGPKSFSETRYYVINILNMVAQIK